MQAMIFAAGMGTRLKPLTDTIPKALVPVGGVTLLERTLRRLREAGFHTVVINVHHFASMIENFLEEHHHFDMDIRISDERAALLETGGAVKHARALFPSAAPVLIHNVDIMSNVDLRHFYSLPPLVDCPDCGVPHQRVAATLLVSQRTTQRYLVFDPQMRLVGWTNVATGEVRSPHPWVKHALTHPQSSPVKLRLLAFAGIHSLSPTLFPEMEQWPDRFPIMDFYLSLCAKVFIRGWEMPNLKLLDVGKLDTLTQAEQWATQTDASPLT